MIYEVELGRACDTLNHELGKQLVQSMDALLVADSIITIQRRQIDLRDQAASVQTDRIANQAEENLELKDQLRNQKRLTIGVGILGVLMVVILIL